MPKYTQAQWEALLAECPEELTKNDILKTLYEEGPNALWSDVVRMKQLVEDSMYNHLTGIFDTRTLQDYKGYTEIAEEYHTPYIPVDFSIFRRTMVDCSIDDANECRMDYCEIPKGGITKLPEHKMFKWGFKTQPICIANIRTSDKVRQVAKMFVNERFAVEERSINSFFIMAMIEMLGHKHVLQYDDNWVPVDSTNPRNPVQSYAYSYMSSKFPSVTDLNKIGPLDMEVLDIFGRGFALGRASNKVGTGPRGEPLFELWHAEDWYIQNILNNPEHVERLKYFVKPQDLYGYKAYNAKTGEREVLGNFVLKQIDALPRFAESTTGGLTMIDTHVEVEVDQGTQPIMNFRGYTNAPFLMAVGLGKGVGEILTRPDITTGIEGLPIKPITGNGEWEYWNEYDKECNPEKNMPYFKKRFEMGFKLKDADKSFGILYRNRRFRSRPVNTCDLMPIVQVEPRVTNCDVTTIGCNPKNDAASNNIMETNDAEIRRIKCSALVCGDSSSTTYMVKVFRENIDSISPNQEPLQGCGCGDTVQVFISDADGDVAKIRDATILQYFRPNIVTPEPQYLVKLASSLSAGECIKFIGCKDESPTTATVLACYDNSDDENIAEGSVRFTLDSALPCNVGANVTITYRDADGDAIGATVTGTIVSVDPELMTYVISSTDETGLPGGTAAFNCNMRTGQVSVTIVCA